jgi:glycosyltransferase involved in cell wall biosynthesis
MSRVSRSSGTVTCEAIGRLLFRLADRCICYSEAGRTETIRHAGVSPERIHLVPLGFDWERLGLGVRPEQKRAIVLTVGGIDGSTIHRKGLLTIARMTHLLPEVPVIFAGRAEPGALAALQQEAGPNARFVGVVTDAELDRLYADAQVYVQPSLHEAFGCAVAEAMLYGCTPVVSDRGSLPEVVGETGYIVPPEDPEALARAVREALSGLPSGPELPRDRIRRRFPLAQRRESLYDVLDRLLES